MKYHYGTFSDIFILSIYHLAAASCYIELIVKEADNNVKLIVLGRFDELREKHEKVLDDLVMEILRVLSRCEHACCEYGIAQALILTPWNT